MPGGGELAERGGSLVLHKHWYWSLFKMLASDIKYRAMSMRQLRLFPTLFGQDLSGVFQQTYSGQGRSASQSFVISESPALAPFVCLCPIYLSLRHAFTSGLHILSPTTHSLLPTHPPVTIIPPFRLLDSFGTNAILTPTADGIRYYLDTGRRSTWRHLAHIKYLMAIDVELARCIAGVAAGRPLPTAPRRSPTTTIPPPSLASFRAAAAGGSVGASMATDGDLEDDDYSLGVSLGAWSTTAPDDDEGRRAAENENAGGTMTGDGNDHDNDDDLVLGEFKFVGAGPRASLSLGKRPSLPPLQRAPSGAGAGDGDGPAVAAAPHGGVLDMLSPAGRRARQLSVAAGETLLGALTTRLRWLEQENRKLTEQVSKVLGSVEHAPMVDGRRRRGRRRAGQRGKVPESAVAGGGRHAAAAALETGLI